LTEKLLEEHNNQKMNKSGKSVKRTGSNRSHGTSTQSMATSAMQETVDNQIEMPLADQITMGPIQKYKKYNVFPWEFIIHICIVMMTTLQILAMVETTGGYSRN